MRKTVYVYSPSASDADVMLGAVLRGTKDLDISGVKIPNLGWLKTNFNQNCLLILFGVGRSWEYLLRAVRDFEPGICVVVVGDGCHVGISSPVPNLIIPGGRDPDIVVELVKLARLFE